MSNGRPLEKPKLKSGSNKVPDGPTAKVKLWRMSEAVASGHDPRDRVTVLLRLLWTRTASPSAMPLALQVAARCSISRSLAAIDPAQFAPCDGFVERPTQGPKLISHWSMLRCGS